MEVTYKLEDLHKMKVMELKKILKDRGLTASGNKSELIERLQNVSDARLDLSTSEAVEDDSVLDETSDQISAEQSPVATPPAAAKKILSVAPVTVEPVKTTKPVTTLITAPTAAASSQLASAAAGGMSARMKRFGVVSEEARKAARQERFQAGTAKALDATEKPSLAASKPVSGPDVLKKRAERFGGQASSTSSASVGKTSDVELLKKRATRFGQVTAAKLAKVDEQERVLKRKERFGESTAAATKTAVSGDTNELKKRRLERFGATVAVQ
jgi:SAP domain-containing ribonucleoprotein